MIDNEKYVSVLARKWPIIYNAFAGRSARLATANYGDRRMNGMKKSREDRPDQKALAGYRKAGAAKGKRDKDLNFKVPPWFHKAFKLEAVRRGVTMREFMMAAFKHLIRRKPKPEAS